VQAGGVALARLAGPADLAASEGYTFDTSGTAPGVLRVRHDSAAQIRIAAMP
jgi:hypothetical protein